MKTLRVIIAGGRDFANYELLKEKADYYLSKQKAEGAEIIIVSGTARGADKLGERYAEERGYKIDRYPANWDLYGKSAGYKRNEVMAENADALIACWNGSRGTKHMIDIANAKGLKVRIVNY